MKISAFPLSTIMMLAASAGIAIADKLIVQPITMDLIFPDDTTEELTSAESMFTESCAKAAHNKYFGNYASGNQAGLYDIDMMEVLQMESHDLLEDMMDEFENDLEDFDDQYEEEYDDIEEIDEGDEYSDGDIYNDDIESMFEEDDDEDFDYDDDQDFDYDDDEDIDNRNLRLKWNKNRHARRRKKAAARAARRPAPKPAPRPAPAPTRPPPPMPTQEDPLAGYRYNPWKEKVPYYTWVKHNPRNEFERLDYTAIVNDPNFEYNEWYEKYLVPMGYRSRALASGKCTLPCHEFPYIDVSRFMPIDLTPKDRRLKKKNKKNKNKEEFKKMKKANKMFCKCVEEGPFPKLNEVMACNLDFEEAMSLGDINK